MQRKEPTTKGAHDAPVAESTESLHAAGDVSEPAQADQAELAELRRRLAEVELERDTARADAEGYGESSRVVTEMSTKLVDKWRIEVDELRAELSETRQREQELRFRRDELQAELDEIRRSRAWQLLGRYRTVRGKVRPRG